MTEEEIRRAREDALRYESEDARRQELVNIRNQAESYAYAVQAELENRKNTMDKRQYRDIRAQLGNLQKQIAKTNPDRITEREAGEIREAREQLERMLGYGGYR